MEEHGIGDPACIREIISEVDTDNVSFHCFSLNSWTQPCHIYANAVNVFSGWKNQLWRILCNDEKWSQTARQTLLVARVSIHQGKLHELPELQPLLVGMFLSFPVVNVYISTNFFPSKRVFAVLTSERSFSPCVNCLSLELDLTTPSVWNDRSIVEDFPSFFVIEFVYPW